MNHLNLLSPAELLHQIKQTPQLIQYIKNQEEWIQIVAVKIDGVFIKYIKQPTRRVQKIALKSNPSAIKYIKDPTYEMLEYVIDNSKDFAHYRYIQHIPETLQFKVIFNDPQAIHHIRNKTDNAVAYHCMQYEL